MERSATGARARLGRACRCSTSTAHRARRAKPRNAAGLYHTAFLMPTRKDLARWLVHAAANRMPLSGLRRSPRQRIRLSRRSRRQRHRGLCRSRSLALAMERRHGHDGDRPARHRRPGLALTDTRVSDYARAPDGLRIGHMHLRVGDLAQADRLLSRRHRLRSDPRAHRRRVPVLGPLSPPSRSQRLAKRRRRPPRRHGHRARLVFAGNRGAGYPRGPGSSACGRPARRLVAIADGIETADPWGTKVRLIQDLTVLTTDRLTRAA